ncbi:Sialidase [Lasiosphaeris hirsuta]|uniref:Sialidase n=1 Tax=Lasiosphaeris hirsuta TaxID=260670 RepID=A0AA40AHI9_9PEZI|nr:Sialidase [Lasiosphaeris hirsuta]
MSVSGPTATFGREPNSNYPRAIVISDNVLLATYAWQDGATAKIVTKMSFDLGASWTAPVGVLSGDARKTQLRNPYLLRTSQGALLCAYLVRQVDGADDKPLHMDLQVSQSDDGARSWRRIGSITSIAPGHGVQGEWEPFLYESGGALQVYYSHELSPSDQDIVLRESSDGGKTWGAPTTVAGAGSPDTRPGMPQVAAAAVSIGEGRERKLIMLHESNVGGEGFKVWARTSTDGGDTWADPHIVFNPVPQPGSRPVSRPQAGGPGVVALPPASSAPGAPTRLVVSFMTNQDQPEQNYSDVANVDMKVISSVDGGATWSPPVKALSSSGWGGLTAVEDGVLVLGATSKGTVVLQKVVY